jgi:SAM-dependent methyltransferase
LVKQQLDGEEILDDEYSQEMMLDILKERMEKTLRQMQSLQKQNIILSPYLEIGAERCQRSLVMENSIHANGGALDISFDMLDSCKFYQKAFNYIKTPVRICCDANNLPIKDNSIPFVFCYETLHHFPDPTPIIKEIYRVLAPGGHFYFDEEPFKQYFHINLYKTSRIYSKNNLGKNLMKKVIDHFFGEKTCNELDYSIIENNDISINMWRDALNCFGNVDVTLNSLYAPGKRMKIKLYDNDIKISLANLLGGTISGICKKNGSFVLQEVKAVTSNLLCPTCGLELNQLYCRNCRKDYPIINNVIFLFDNLKELYPEYINLLE